MSQDESINLDSRSLSDLFRIEVENQSALLTRSLLSLEGQPDPAPLLKDMMRAAHSLKGAARIVGRTAAVKVSHALEDRIVAAQASQQAFSEQQIDVMLAGVDLINRIAAVPDEELERWSSEHHKEVQEFLTRLTSAGSGKEANTVAVASPAANWTPVAPPVVSNLPPTRVSERRVFEEAPKPLADAEVAPEERILRVSSANVDRLLGLAGESMVGASWIDDFAKQIVRLKKRQQELLKITDELQTSLNDVAISNRSRTRLKEIKDGMALLHQTTVEHIGEFDLFNRRSASLSARLYEAVMQCRMRPFGEGVQVFRRMVRDLASTLGKSIKFSIVGEETTVDRDILESLKAPLDHLLRNAIDHGIESPDQRSPLGKPAQGSLELGARHSGGMLLIHLTDDGRGIDSQEIRRAIIEKRLATQEMAERMSELELFEFLFLPGFSLKRSVSEISGRGVGLDVVQTMVRRVGGNIRVFSKVGEGTTFQLELPLSLSVLRTLIVEIGGEPYAVPLARIDSVLKLSRQEIRSIEGRQYFTHGDRQVGLVSASEILQLDLEDPAGDASVIVLTEKNHSYGLVVGSFLGEQKIAVHPLDPRLGKIQNISAGALLPDGSPLLLIDIDDLLGQIENYVSGNRPRAVGEALAQSQVRVKKRILVVEDSLTVRELERKLLQSRGYEVDIAVDGMDGWNAARSNHYDLVVTDVDMPRLDGIELVSMIRKDARLKSLPVMIVSYKDRPEDREKGLEVGADYYLTKGSFHDEALVTAVSDLIGSAEI